MVWKRRPKKKRKWYIRVLRGIGMLMVALPVALYLWVRLDYEIASSDLDHQMAEARKMGINVDMDYPGWSGPETAEGNALLKEIAAELKANSTGEVDEITIDNSKFWAALQDLNPYILPVLIDVTTKGKPIFDKIENFAENPKLKFAINLEQPWLNGGYETNEYTYKQCIRALRNRALLRTYLDQWPEAMEDWNRIVNLFRFEKGAPYYVQAIVLYERLGLIRDLNHVLKLKRIQPTHIVDLMEFVKSWPSVPEWRSASKGAIASGLFEPLKLEEWYRHQWEVDQHQTCGNVVEPEETMFPCSLPRNTIARACTSRYLSDQIRRFKGIQRVNKIDDLQKVDSVVPGLRPTSYHYRYFAFDVADGILYTNLRAIGTEQAFLAACKIFLYKIKSGAWPRSLEQMGLQVWNPYASGVATYQFDQDGFTIFLHSPDPTKKDEPIHGQTLFSYSRFPKKPR